MPYLSILNKSRLSRNARPLKSYSQSASVWSGKASIASSALHLTLTLLKLSNSHNLTLQSRPKSQSRRKKRKRLICMCSGKQMSCRPWVFPKHSAGKDPDMFTELMGEVGTIAHVDSALHCHVHNRIWSRPPTYWRKFQFCRFFHCLFLCLSVSKKKKKKRKQKKEKEKRGGGGEVGENNIVFIQMSLMHGMRSRFNSPTTISQGWAVIHDKKYIWKKNFK